MLIFYALRSFAYEVTAKPSLGPAVDTIWEFNLGFKEFPFLLILL